MKDFRAGQLQDDRDIVNFLREQAEGRSFENDMKSVYFEAARFIEDWIVALETGSLRGPEIVYPKPRFSEGRPGGLLG